MGRRLCTRNERLPGAAGWACGAAHRTARAALPPPRPGRSGRRRSTPRRDRHEPGTGEINFPWLLEHIGRLGYADWIGCEYNPRAKTTDGLGWFTERINGLQFLTIRRYLTFMFAALSFLLAIVAVTQ